MDVGEASGSFGLLAGVLSVLLPYFLGLVVALGILGAGVGILRMPLVAATHGTGRWIFLVAWGPLALGWTIFLSAPGPVASFRGLVLGASAVPLWVTVRRPPAFGGLG